VSFDLLACGARSTIAESLTQKLLALTLAP
jgi:hypothetical protein